MEQNEIDFLVGLDALTRKTGIYIQGGYDCPYLLKAKREDLIDSRSGYANYDSVMWVGA